MYLDKNFVLKNNLPSIQDMGALVFKTKVLRHPRIEEKFMTLMLEQIDAERRGECVQRDTLW